MEGPAASNSENTPDVNPHDSECCICIDNLSDTTFRPCDHIVCLECAVYLSFEKNKQCPLCRTEFKSIVPYFKCSKPSNISDLVKIFPKSDILAKTIMSVAKKITDKTKLISLIHNIGNEISGFMSLTEAETILQYLKDNGKNASEIGNMIVRMCNTPWLVDVKLASSGVCYFGNFGDIPSLSLLLSLLCSNRGHNFKSVSFQP
jgi:uncharacterized protein YeeX (DUF496 family)